MVRCWVGLVVGTLTGYVAACGGGRGFACQQDTDCVLAGTPGMCDGEGHCAYPDADCASGFSYPVSVPKLGGQCASQVGGSETGETGGPDDGGGSQGADDGGSTLGVDGDVGDGTQTGRGDGSTGGSTTGDPTTGGSTTGFVCPDPDADTLPASTVFGGCEVATQGTLVDLGDADWFTLFGGCPTGQYDLTVNRDGAADMTGCIFAGCSVTAGASNATCLNGTPPVSVDGFVGCCGIGSVQGVLGCGTPAQSMVDPFFAVMWDGEAMAPSCAPYSLVLNYLGAAAPG